MYRGVGVYAVKLLPVNSRALGLVSLSKPISIDLVTELARVAFFQIILCPEMQVNETRQCSLEL